MDGPGSRPGGERGEIRTTGRPFYLDAALWERVIALDLEDEIRQVVAQEKNRNSALVATAIVLEEAGISTELSFAMGGDPYLVPTDASRD